jgi:xylan 1,4-beta-xylosidase
MGIANQLRNVNNNFEVVASFPELRNTPIVIGESDPEGCAACQGEHLAYRNGTMYSSYTAASFARKHDLADRHGVNFEGALSWAFTFEDQAYFAGFRQLASNGLAMPVLNVFRMFSKMSGDRLSAESSSQVSLDAILEDGVRDNPDVGVFASRDDSKVAMMIWHYHDNDLPGPDAAISVAVNNLPGGVENATLTHYRIDEFHSNSYDAWRRMGSPVAPNQRQYNQLEEESNLATIGDPKTVRVSLPYILSDRAHKVLPGCI